MLRFAAKLLKVLNAETDPAQISLAFCFAMVAGFTPLLSIHNIFILFLVLLLRVNLSAFILGLAVFSGLAYIIDPLFHRLGLGLLTTGSLEGLWTSMFNSTMWRLEKFNNSIVMGSLACSIVLFVPFFLVSNILIRKYREHVITWVNKSHIMQVIKASKFYHIYRTVSGWRTGS